MSPGPPEPPGGVSAGAADRWREQLAGWGLPSRILERAPETPWFHDRALRTADDTVDGAAVSTRWAREVLPPVGGTVLDVGCGGGRAALALVPPATELIGVDRSGAMLDAFVAAAEAAGVARRTVHGAWPEVAPITPPADVVVCHHVVYDVGDVVPFLLALTVHARLAVVVELPTVHPMSAWTPAWRHFWDLDRPLGPTADDLLAVLDELGLDPESTVERRRPRAVDADRGAALVTSARRRLCLPAERDPEIAGWLASNPVPWVETMMTIRWPGAFEHDA